MKKTRFWFMQIVMVAIVGFVLGSPVFADKDKTQKALSADEMSHGEMTRLENANLDNGDAEWKTLEPEPEECPDGTEGEYPDCTPVDPPDDCVPDFGNPCP